MFLALFLYETEIVNKKLELNIYLLQFVFVGFDKHSIEKINVTLIQGY